jgi:hypothetical protein
MPARRKIAPGAKLADLASSWELSLQAAQKSPKTVTSYLATLGRLTAWLEAEGRPADAEGVDAQTSKPSSRPRSTAPPQLAPPSTTATSPVFFGWLEREGERTALNPVRRAEEPKVPRKVKPALTHPGADRHGLKPPSSSSGTPTHARPWTNQSRRCALPSNHSSDTAHPSVLCILPSTRTRCTPRRRRGIRG